MLVANAGITRDKLLVLMSEDDFSAVLDTNLTGAFRVAKRAVRPMIRMRSGRIILISSVVGMLGSGGQANYAASKAGLVGLARSLTRELGSRNITVNVVAPGFVDTDMTAALPAERKAEILKNIPLGRYAAPDEVAGVVEFLAGPAAALHHGRGHPGGWRHGNGPLMGILDGKRILVTGVLTDSSIAFHVARIAQLEGATVVLTGFGRLSLVERIARRLPQPPPVIELDVTDSGQLASLAERVSAHVDGLDGLVHAIAFAPQGALGGNFLSTPWEDVATAVHVSAYSLKALAVAALPLMTGLERRPGRGSGSPGPPARARRSRPAGRALGSIVGLDFDASRAWPAYDWMGVAKAGLESCARYLARDLGPKGIRVNLVAAGPIRTMAANSIPGFAQFEKMWGERAPLGWDITDPGPAARACVALLSDWFPATTGEIVHVDGGAHAIGG